MNRLLIFMVVAGTAWFVGCGPSGPVTAAVKGKVTVAGTGPLTGGGIIFVSKSDTKLSGSGPIQADGTYDVGAAPVGECKVTISNIELKNTGAARAPGRGGPPGGAVGSAPAGLDIGAMGGAGTKAYIPIDPSFGSHETTTLTATVKRGENSIDFEVK